MKNIIHICFVLFVLLHTYTASSQNLIAVQYDNTSTYYSSLDSAITYAKNGSYIYIPGGSFNLTKPIDKELHIVGVGHNPDSCAETGISEVVGSIYIKDGSDHGSITGLKIVGGILLGQFNSYGQAYSYTNIDNYHIYRSKIIGGITLSPKSSNIIINECILSGTITGNKIKYFQLSKCIVETVKGGSLSSFDSNSLFTNNIFLNNSSNYYTISNVNYSNFKNNIFLCKLEPAISSSESGSTNNQLKNNLFNLNVNMLTSNLFQYNIIGPISTIFKNQSGFYFDYKQDYHILPNSPAHNAGTDGTDLGIYGTENPWKEGSLPNNPHIQSSSISTINGVLNVKIKVASQDK